MMGNLGSPSLTVALHSVVAKSTNDEASRGLLIDTTTCNAGSCTKVSGPRVQRCRLSPERHDD
jgi:hypothetical protein